MTANSETLDIDGRSVELSKGDKVMYPDDGFTKRDVVCHYRAVAPVMLPHVRGNR
ncbi:hypothetical protein ACFQ0O_16385 [Saccharopolyspora spinosporotrichia]